MPTSRPVHYQIDADNRIAEVNEAWDDFALGNDGHHLLGTSVRGQPLFAFITDPTTRQLYHTMLARVRERRRPLMIHFRCDAPDRRRDMTLELRPVEDSTAVDFVVYTLTDNDRPPVSLIDAHASRDDRVLRMCGWCKRVHLPTNTWVEVEEAIGPLEIFTRPTVPQLSHGICGECEAEVLAALQDSSFEAA